VLECLGALTISLSLSFLPQQCLCAVHAKLFIVIFTSYIIAKNSIIRSIQLIHGGHVTLLLFFLC